MIERRTHRPRRLRIGAIAVIPALAGGALAAGAPQAVGIASAVLNDVSIESAGTRQFRHAVLRQRVALADQVQTGQRSQLQVLLLDRSVFTVGANARLTIDRYVYDPASGRSFSASVAKGAFRFMSGRPDRGGNSSINTPVAAIGIRGTIVDGVVGAEAIAIANGERGIGQNRDSDPLTATLVVLRGPGQLTQGNAIPGEITVTAGGKTVTLDRPMLAAYVPRSGAAPIGPFTISFSGLARVQALIFPSLAEWIAATAPVSNTPYPPSSTRDPRRPRPVLIFPPDNGGGGAGGGAMPPPYGAGMPGLPQFPGGAGFPADQQPQPRPQSGAAGVQQPSSVAPQSTTAGTTTPQSQPTAPAPQSTTPAPAPQVPAATGTTQQPAPQTGTMTPSSQTPARSSAPTSSSPQPPPATPPAGAPPPATKALPAGVAGTPAGGKGARPTIP